MSTDREWAKYTCCVCGEETTAPYYGTAPATVMCAMHRGLQTAARAVKRLDALADAAAASRLEGVIVNRADLREILSLVKHHVDLQPKSRGLGRRVEDRAWRERG